MTDKAFENATIELLRKLEMKKEALLKEYQSRLAKIDREIEAVSTTRQLLREPESLEVSISDSLVLADSIAVATLRNKSTREALIEIAKKNNGMVVINHAKSLLLEAGIINKKHAWGKIYTTLSRSKEFIKDSAPGTFRLVTPQNALPLQ